jgi:hypothetical protein
MNSKPAIAPVINTSSPVFMNNKVMGTIQYDMRMRLPIHDQVSKALNMSDNVASTDVE